ncbi:hypothetical protein EV183_003464 [Coemansia sp. RSA 2336]|nr:hypothetical protein EV183_003464 [Coemansia sp. RSA 2336]
MASVAATKGAAQRAYKALRQSPHALSKARMHEAATESSRLDKLGRKLTSAFQATQQQQQPEPVDPQFSIVDSKHGSIVHAKLPPYSQLVTRVGQLVGQAPGAYARATTHGTFAVAALRPLLGRSAFVQQVSTDNCTADVLIAPRKAGDMAVVGVSGAVDYFVRRGCLLAQSKFLSASTWHGIGAAFNILAFDRVSGRGSMVINTVGGLHRLVLKENEEYFVDPRFVVAWSSSLDIQPQSGRPAPLHPKRDIAKHPVASANQLSTQPTPFVASSSAVNNTVAAPSRSPAKPMQSLRMSSMRDLTKLGSKLMDYTVFPAGRAVANGLRAAAYASANLARVAAWFSAKSIRTLAGVPDLYRITGPGEIYISSRVQPKPWSRITEYISTKSS